MPPARNKMSRKDVTAAILKHEDAEFGPDALTSAQLDKLFRSRLCLDIWLSTGNTLLAYGFVTKRKGDIYQLERLCVTDEGKHINRLGTYLHDTLICTEPKVIFHCYVPERSVREQYWMSRHGWVAVGIEKGYYHSGDAIKFMRGDGINEIVPGQDQNAGKRGHS